MSTCNEQTTEEKAEAFRAILEKSLNGDAAQLDALSDATKEKIARAHAMLDALFAKHASLLKAKEEGKTTKAWLISEIDSLQKTDEASGEKVPLDDVEKRAVADALTTALEEKFTEAAAEIELEKGE
ncbi:MAG: hypothetical protein ACI4QA_04415 [Candidatus Spyradosoma sp.]